MILPSIGSRIEQRDLLAGVLIHRSQICALMRIAVMARPSKVLSVVSTAMLAGDNVLDVKAIEGIILLMDQAVFTSVAGAVTNELADGRIHVA